MNDTLSVAMVYCLEKFFHVNPSLPFIESLVRHACNLVKELHALDIFHNQVYVLCIVVGFKILDDIGVIKFVQNFNLLHYALDILRQFMFVKDFNGDLKILIILICCHKHSPKCSNTKHFCFIVDHIVLFEL